MEAASCRIDRNWEHRYFPFACCKLLWTVCIDGIVPLVQAMWIYKYQYAFEDHSKQYFAQAPALVELASSFFFPTAVVGACALEGSRRFDVLSPLCGWLVSLSVVQLVGEVSKC